MDEFIYILLLVAWVAYSIYNAKQKKKQKEMKSKPVSEPQPGYEAVEEEKPKRSVLEELFGETEFGEFLETETEEEPEVEVVHAAPPERTYYQTSILPEIAAEGRDKKTLFSGSETDAKEEQVLTVTTATYGSDFNLRKAVIYSAILERPYE